MATTRVLACAGPDPVTPQGLSVGASNAWGLPSMSPIVPGRRGQGLYGVCLGFLWRELGKWGMPPECLHFSAVLGTGQEASVQGRKYEHLGEFSHGWKKSPCPMAGNTQRKNGQTW